MKKINLHLKVMLLISVLLISSKNIYSQWTITGDLPGIEGRPTVSVVDGSTAFVTGGQTVNATYKTTNGGRNWIQLNTGTFGIFWSIWAKDANTVFAGANGISSVGDTIRLYKTTDGGNSWTVIESNFAEIATFTGIKFSKSDPSFGIAVGGAPDADFYIYKTRDGGNTWTGTQVTGFSGFNSALNSLIVIDSLFYAHGTVGVSPAIIITTDGGVTWNLRDLNNPSPGFSTSGIAFKEDKLTGIAGAGLPIISRTTDGGIHWVNIDVGNNITVGAAIRMRWIEGTNTCYLNASESPEGGVLKSTNGGLNWTPMTTSGLRVYNIDTKRFGSNIYGYANSNVGGLFGGSQVLKVTDTVEGIPAPSDLSALSVDSSFIRISWLDNSIDEDGFYIERTQINDTSHWEVIDAVIQNVNQYSDYLVTRNLKYYYRVKAYSGNIFSGYSNTDSAILGGNPSVIPVPPSKLTLFKRTPKAISMGWHDNSGNENGFIIFRKSERDLFFKIIDSVNTDVVTYQEVGVSPILNYYYKICSYNSSGISDFSNTLTVLKGKNPLWYIKTPELSGNYILYENYPNPFNPVTNLEFGISKLGFVSLKIYDMLGKEVATLVNASLNPGTYKYSFDASSLPSGVYFYKLTVDGNNIDTKRMILLK